MRILVTGGTGFIGSAFVQAAEARGHELLLLRRSEGGLARPPWEKLAAFAPEVCLHAAWIATPGVYLESPENEDWVRWSRAFLTRLPALGVRHVVALGTCIEYGMTGAPLREEEAPLQPLSAYARAKAALHARLQEELAVPCAWARLFYPYGVGEHPDRLASALIRRFRAGTPFLLKTPLSLKDYVHVRDVAAGLLALVEQSFAGAVNVGTGQGVAVGELAAQVAALLGRPELLLRPEAPPRDPLDHVVADSSRLRALGWEPAVSLEEGLRELVAAA